MTEIENEGEVVGVSSELQYFVEKDVCLNLLAELCGPLTPAEFKPKYEEYNKVMLKYLEQPLLLNPHIVDMVAPLSQSLSLVTSNRPGKEVSSFNHHSLSSHKHATTVLHSYTL